MAVPLPPQRPWCAPTPTPTPNGSPTPCRRSPTNPCKQPQWDRYADLIGVDPAQVPWADSTDVQRDELLIVAVRNLLNTTTPAAITTPPLIWWHGTVPDDADTTWENTPVPGWNGTLGDYLAALVEDYATNPDHSWDEHQCIPPAATACGQPAETTAILATIRHFESGDDYTQQSHAVATDGRNGGGNPTGAYQFVYTSWGNYAGYAEAFMAPPNVQDELATTNVTSILDAFDGDPAWVPVAWYVGMGGARNVQNGTWSTAYVPNPAYNHISIGDYQARWLDYYTTIALPGAGGTATVCPQGGQAAVAWAETQIGAPYAAANGYRFGAPPWPGGTIIGDRGDRYTFPAGTIVYDCSGFVVAAWRSRRCRPRRPVRPLRLPSVPQLTTRGDRPISGRPRRPRRLLRVRHRRRPHRHDPRRRRRRHRPHHRSHPQQRRPHRHHRLVTRHQHQTAPQPGAPPAPDPP